MIMPRRRNTLDTCLLVKNPESYETIFERCKIMDHPILKEFPRGVRFYVDGTEIRCDIPSNSTCAQAAYSSYKHYHTHKFQLGIDPTGKVQWVSLGFPGGFSDHDCLKYSDFLSSIVRGGDCFATDIGYEESRVAMGFTSYYLPVNSPGRGFPPLNQQKVFSFLLFIIYSFIFNLFILFHSFARISLHMDVIAV